MKTFRWNRSMRPTGSLFAIAIALASVDRCPAGMLSLNVNPTSSELAVFGQIGDEVVGPEFVGSPPRPRDPRLQPQAVSALTLEAITGNVALDVASGSISQAAVLSLVGPLDPILGIFIGFDGTVEISIDQLEISLSGDGPAIDALPPFFDGNDDIIAFLRPEVEVTSGVVTLRVTGGEFDGVVASVDLTGPALDESSESLSLWNQSPYQMSQPLSFRLGVDLAQTPIGRSQMDLFFAGTIAANEQPGGIVPEPSSIALLGMGSLTLLGCRWRRRHSCRRSREESC